ncbi:adhesion G-protein coupled receptor G6 isoform X1 [Alosa alosa]|uniref:adhesion G-protein coupled receptor G6 isoform X1 n=1 Tax=Alosa alosa TaxID=278164 RepID=UPI0020151500|nr:adhesion G-protein coupled receptor G6 isoform X1 [Alosa alosa]
MVLNVDRENRTLTEALDYASGIEPFFNSDIGVNPFGLYDLDSIYSHVETMNSDHLDATIYNDVLILSNPTTPPSNVDKLFHSQYAILPWGVTEATVLQTTMWSRWSIPINSVQTLLSRGALMEMYEPSANSRQKTDNSISSEIILHNYKTDFHLMSTQSWHTPLSSVGVLHEHSKGILTPTPVLSLLPTNHKTSPKNKTLQLLAFNSSTQSNGAFSMAKPLFLSLPSLIITEKTIQPLTDTVHENMSLNLSQNREPLEASLTHSIYFQHDLLTTDDIVPAQLYLEHLTAIATAMTPDSPRTSNMFPSKSVSDSILPSLRSHFNSILSDYLEDTQPKIPFGELSSNWPMRTGVIMPDSTRKSQIDIPHTSNLSQIYGSRFTETPMFGSKGHKHYANTNNVSMMTSFHMSFNTVLISGRMTLDVLPTILLSPQTGLTQSHSGLEWSLTSSVSSTDIVSHKLSYILLKPSKPQHGHLELFNPIDTSIDLPIETLSTDNDLSQLQMSPSHLIEHSTFYSQGKWYEWGFSTLHLPFSTNSLPVHSASMNPFPKYTVMDAAHSSTDTSPRVISTVMEKAQSAGSVSFPHTEITVSSLQSHITPGSQSAVKAPSIAKNNTFPSNTKPTTFVNSGLSSSGTQYREDGHNDHPLSTDDKLASQIGHGNKEAAVQVSTTLFPLTGDNHSLVHTPMSFSALPDRVTALDSTVPFSTTPWSFPVLTELASCPCKTHSHVVCLCGRAAGNKVFYRVELVFPQQNEPDVTELTELLKSTSHYWIYPKHVKCDRDNKCQAILVHNMTMNSSAIMADIKDRLRSSTMDENGSVVVTLETVENCPEEKDLSDDRYKWLESRPMVTVHIPCLHFKDQYASRTCFIDSRDFKSKWNDSDAANCPSIKDIEVSEETAADVAVQLADISNSELSKEEVSTVVTKVKELVNVARINKTLAEAVVNIISNVMTSSSTAQAAASEIALRAVDNLVQKIEFEGPIFRTSSKNLAVGISAVNASEFNGTTFSAIIPPNTTEPEIKFLAESENPLAVVTLPATLLLNLTNANIEAISRINFVFFSKTGLFQDDIRNGLSLNSYVVASSVGNFSIRNLKDPVRIEIAHLLHKPDPKRSCVFWDFTIKNGIGGWNSEGCLVSPDSSDNRTVCLCNHLTHFGILMDISGTAAQIDYQNTRVLTFITYIGCGVSAIFSAATLLTYITFEKLRRDHPAKILMNLSTSLLFLNMVFLLDGWLASFGMEGLCIAVAVFMHFFLLTSFTWMGLESIHMYMALVKVFNTYIRRYILKFCLVGWGLPAAIVCIVVAVDKHSYGLEYYGKGDIGQESSKFCWIRSNTVFYVTCVGYFSIIFLMNVAMFIVVMIQICGRNGKRSNRTLREEILRNLRSVVSLTFLLGMTWGFAFFAWGPVNLAFMYLFSIFNSLQGLFIFVFHCALKENVQKQWRRYLCCGQLRLADNSDWSKTATNNTKKVSSDNLGKSLSSSSFSSSTANWTSKAKASLNPFANYNNSSDKISSSPINFKCCPSDGEASIIPVHHVIDKMKGYCSVRSEHFYKNFIMSDNFNHNTKF